MLAGLAASPAGNVRFSTTTNSGKRLINSQEFTGGGSIWQTPSCQEGQVGVGARGALLQIFLLSKLGSYSFRCPFVVELPSHKRTQNTTSPRLGLKAAGPHVPPELGTLLQQLGQNMAEGRQLRLARTARKASKRELKDCSLSRCSLHFIAPKPGCPPLSLGAPCVGNLDLLLMARTAVTSPIH